LRSHPINPDEKKEMIMRSWTLIEPGAPLRPVDAITPHPTGSQVLLELAHCGVCHSDLHTWEGFYDIGGGRRLDLAARGISLPRVLGHEMVGRVAATGPDAPGLQVGDVRIVYPWIGCGHCLACRAGADNLCPALRSLGIYRDGGYSTHVIVDHPRYLADPKTLDPAVAATYACSGISAYAATAKLGHLDRTEPVVVVGAGGLGLNAIAVLAALGYEHIVVADTTPAKRDAAQEYGASVVVDAAATPGVVTSRIVEACGGPVRGIIDFVNSGASARAAVDALAKAGTLVQVGLFGGEVTLALPVMATKALTVTGSFVGSPQQLHDLVDLAAGGAVRPLPVETVPLDDVNDALVRLKEGHITGRLVLANDDSGATR
jgi:alcohol dehydrogenase, propanol-preferring